jgi:hypothetical protein
MEVKLISCDGLWKIHNVPDSIRPFDDIIMPFFYPCTSFSEMSDLVVKQAKRRYTYQGRDDHGMCQFKEVWNG